MCLSPEQRTCLLTNLCDNDISFQRKEQACILPNIKDSDSTSQDFSSGTQHTVCDPSIWIHLRDKGKLTSLVTVISVNNKLFFISDPRFSCLLPASMKLRQTNILLYKWSKILDVSWFWTIFNVLEERIC